jgi:hypothetical protein
MLSLKKEILELLTYSDASQNLSLPEIFIGSPGSPIPFHGQSSVLLPNFSGKSPTKKVLLCRMKKSPHVDLYQLYPMPIIGYHPLVIEKVAMENHQC